eukprot:TRINITY_DN17116_c0_g1_i1.p2 TRINITY_DN17116_c0_g1~~TRINITY_DN17116_c0_g1_i1.p2  ORF type:complete len:299 (+),score=49.04 TRINITY_DN17116_c0_g1_i1:198-1094(+)
MKKKVLLMGKSGSGKTSMRSIIFANYVARDTGRLGATINVEHTHIRFLGNIFLNLWDCGGQEAFMENYLSSQRDHIFSDAEVLIFVFDAESHDVSKDLHYFKTCLDSLKTFSPDARVFCLFHKMDLVPEESREAVYSRKVAEMKAISGGVDVQQFQTSIWDETLYKAWSNIVYTLIPKIEVLKKALSGFCIASGAAEVVIFERATFLQVANHSTAEHRDVNRFEKVSNIVKQFKLSCAQSNTKFESLSISTDKFTAFLDVFTPNTSILVIYYDQSISKAAMELNIQVFRKHASSNLAV